MADEWVTSKLGDVFTLTPGFAFKSGDFGDSGTPVLKIKNVKAGKVVLDDLSYVADSFVETRANYLVRHDDILITLSGNRIDGSKETWVGKVAQFRTNGHYLLNQRVAILRPKTADSVDLRYCAYLMGGDEYQHQFISIATSSGGQANLSSAQVLSAEITLPPRQQQQAIACILGALDDKIELNRRRNRTLEAMARAIFQSWFIDFDPVKAKAAGQPPPGLTPALAALFPDSFEDSKLGLIPAGWRARPLPEICLVNPMRSLSKGTLAPYLDMSNMPTQGPSPDSWVLREMGSGMKFINGDTLVARITPCLENGKTAFVDFLSDGEVAWGSTEYIVLRPKDPCPRFLLTCWLAPMTSEPSPFKR